MTITNTFALPDIELTRSLLNPIVKNNAGFEHCAHFTA